MRERDSEGSVWDRRSAVEDVWVAGDAENRPRGQQAQVLAHWAGLLREATLLSVLNWIHWGGGPSLPAAFPAES